tara:strand:+ start:51 stop:695 length:645 start_codon:yes stop_codon:yes gene_type:complete
MNKISLYENQKTVLNEIHEILKRNSFLDKCTIGFGTFLGAYRQKKLNTSINNWDDIDFDILYKNFATFKNIILIELIKNDFILVHAHLIKKNNVIGSLTLQKENTRIDFQIIFESKNKKCYHFLWHGGIEMAKAFPQKYYYNLKEYDLENNLFFGPLDAESYIVDMYGEDWRTPCTSESEYKFWEDSPGKPWDLKYRHYKLVRNKELKEIINAS